MSTSNWVTNMGTGAIQGATTGAVLAAPAGGISAPVGGIIGGVLGAGLGAFGALEADKNDEKLKQSKIVSDPATPYKVKLPSGATVTMWAHGKPRQTAYNPNNSAAAGMAALNTAAALTQKYKSGQGASNAAGGADYDAGSAGTTTVPGMSAYSQGPTQSGINPQDTYDFMAELDKRESKLTKSERWDSPNL